MSLQSLKSEKARLKIGRPPLQSVFSEPKSFLAHHLLRAHRWGRGANRPGRTRVSRARESPEADPQRWGVCFAIKPVTLHLLDKPPSKGAGVPHSGPCLSVSLQALPAPDLHSAARDPIKLREPLALCLLLGLCGDMLALLTSASPSAIAT